jgi:hypothetical protein
MADPASDDIPEIDDIPLMRAPDEPAETATETTTAPVQPVEPSQGQTSTTDEGDTTSPTGNPSDDTQASEPKPGEPTKLQEGKTPEEGRAPAHEAWIERQRAKSDATRVINENYSAPTEEQLVEQGMSEQEAKVQAAIEQLSFERERTRVAELNAGLRDEAVQVQQTMGMFNPNSPDYDKEFSEQVGEAYKQYARVQIDENGIIMNADVSLLDYYKQQYDLYNRGLSRGQQKAQANSEQMLARTENPGGSSSTKSSGASTLEEIAEKYGDAPLFG